MDLSAKAGEPVACCCMRRSHSMPETMRYWVLLMPGLQSGQGQGEAPAIASHRGQGVPTLALRGRPSRRSVIDCAKHYRYLRPESDIYEHFAQRPANVELIVRSGWNRKIELKSGDCAKQFAFMDGFPEAARFSVTVPAAPGRKERVAELPCASRR